MTADDNGSDSDDENGDGAAMLIELGERE